MRIVTRPRHDWQNKVEECGMYYHTIDEEVYWDESAYYSFTASEIDEIELATDELQRICIDAVEYVISNNLYEKLKIPAVAVPLIEKSWNADEPSLYGRFDLAYDGNSPPKMLEYNADTPTALLEASVVQWFWLKERFPEADQFNSIHEKCIDCWKQIRQHMDSTLYFSCVSNSMEDLGNLEYLRDTAIQADICTDLIFIEDIGYDSVSQHFVGNSNDTINYLFKLYPWEWLVSELFGKHIETGAISMIEPAWKMVLSNKAILPILWEMFPNHPNLLEASFNDKHFSDDFISKPFLSREGCNINIHRKGVVTEYGGIYTDQGTIYQKLANLPCFDGNYPIIGSWIINGDAAGIGIREDRSEVTTNASRFVPHLFH